MAWHCKAKGGYAETTAEAHENADKIRWLLNNMGWTDNAVCGALGSMAHESGLNPWRWQGDSVKTYAGAKTTSLGYGLVQATPAKKYVIEQESALKDLGFGPNFSDRPGNTLDGQAQCYWIDRVQGQWTPNNTNVGGMTYAEYKVSTLEAGELAVKWLYGFERPQYPEQTRQARIDSARYFWEYFGGQTPEPDPPPDPPEPPPGPEPEPPDKIPYESTFHWIYYLRRPHKL